MTIQEFVEETGIEVSSVDYRRYEFDDFDLETWYSILASPYDCF